MNYRIYQPLLLLLSVVLFSCNIEGDVPETNVRAIALEVHTHSTTIDQTAYINSSEHADFITPQLSAFLEKDPFLRQKVRNVGQQEPDTIFTYDEIPYIRETKTETRIFADGVPEFIIDDLTPVSGNLIFQLSENPESEENRISRTVIRDGWLQVYNVSGEVIARENYPVPDMTTFIDSMKFYLQMIGNEKGSAGLVSEKIRRLRKSGQGKMEIKILPDRRVVIETELQRKVNLSPFLPENSEIIKAVTELNPDMNRTLSYEVFRGEQLIQRKMYQYDESLPLKSYFHNQLVMESPSVIESQSLVLNGKGQPVIKAVREVFHRNQMIFH